METFSGLKVKVDRLAQVVSSIESLTKYRTLVGIPQEKNSRKGGTIGNAALLYIHSNGAPEVGIPARPSLEPAVRRKQAEIAELFKKTALAALSGDQALVQRGFQMAGMMVSTEAKMVIQEGIPPPLQPATVAARARRSKGSKYRRRATAVDQQAHINALAAGKVSESPTTPLYDTGALLRAITYVVRKRSV